MPARQPLLSIAARRARNDCRQVVLHAQALGLEVAAPSAGSAGRRPARGPSRVTPRARSAPHLGGVVRHEAHALRRRGARACRARRRSGARRRAGRAGGSRRRCRGRATGARTRGSCSRGRCRAPPAGGRGRRPRRARATAAIAASSCSLQSHLSDPKTSLVMHSEWTRTSTSSLAAHVAEDERHVLVRGSTYVVEVAVSRREGVARGEATRWRDSRNVEAGSPAGGRASQSP